MLENKAADERDEKHPISKPLYKRLACCCMFPVKVQIIPLGCRTRQSFEAQVTLDASFTLFNSAISTRPAVRGRPFQHPAEQTHADAIQNGDR